MVLPDQVQGRRPERSKPFSWCLLLQLCLENAPLSEGRSKGFFDRLKDGNGAERDREVTLLPSQHALHIPLPYIQSNRPRGFCSRLSGTTPEGCWRDSKTSASHAPIPLLPS